MSFEERKKKARSFENTAGDYLRERFSHSHRITEQKTFVSGKRLDAWLVGKEDHRNRIVGEIKCHAETRVAQESDFRQLRMYQHQGHADKGLMIYPDYVRVPHELTFSARKQPRDRQTT